MLDGFIAKVRKYIEREKEQKQEPGQNDVSDVTEEETEKSPEVPSITGQETVEVEIIPQTTVAIETSDDYAEPEFGFYTHQYADGRDGTRYRLVEMDEDGYLVPYLPDHKFFLNRELIQEYIDAHGDVLDVISYDDMVYDSIKTQEKKEISDPIEGITEERADADALLKPKQDMSGHNVQTQEEEPKEQKMAEIPLEPKKQETAEATIEPTGQETTEVAVEPVGQGTTEVTVKSVEQETTEVVAEPAGEEKEPALPTSTAVNFRITDDIFGVDVEKANTGFSPKEKFRRNIEAIRTLKKIEGENRIATPEEQKILSQ